MKLTLLTLGIGALASCGASNQPEHVQLDTLNIVQHGCPEPIGKPKDVGVPELIANPGAFHAVLVRVSGHHHDGFEHNAIYPGLKREPDEHKFSDGIWLLQVDPNFSGDPVQITGYFTASINGHLGQWPGSICVTSVASAPEHAP